MLKYKVHVKQNSIEESFFIKKVRTLGLKFQVLTKNLIGLAVKQWIDAKWNNDCEGKNFCLPLHTGL